MSYPPPPAGEADEAPAAPVSKRPWTKPRIKPLRVISTYTGTKTSPSYDEDNAFSPADPIGTYAPQS